MNNKRTDYVLSLTFMLGIATAQAATPVFINEIHYDNTGTDGGEAIEIAGPAGTDLSAWSIVLYNGNNASPYDTKPLSGVISDQSGNGFGAISFDYPTNGIQNGAPDGIALVDANNTVVQFLSYEGVFSAVGGSADGMSSNDIGVSESGGTPIGHSLQLIGNGSQYEDFTWSTASANSFGSINARQSFGASPPPPVSQCGQGFTLISAIQGRNGVSPLTGTVQHIEAVVTADFSGSANLNGFFVQQADDENDGDPATSEALFVASNQTLSVADRVHIVGTVAETFGMTRLNNVSAVDICSSGNALPDAVDVNLPFDDFVNNPESREGMLVRLPQTLTVTENYNLARYGEFLLSSGGRLIAPTQIAVPGSAANAVAAKNAVNRLLVDDGTNRQNPDPVIYPEPDGLSAGNSLRSGDTVSDATGILSYDFGAYRLQPTQPLKFVKANERTEAPRLNTLGSLKVASFNVLNYFNGDGFGGGFPASRGADSREEFNRQRAKILSAIFALDADVIGLIEIENDGYDGTSAIADLVAGLNRLAGSGIYAFVYPGQSKIGTDEISVGLIYRPAKVALIGTAAILDASVDPRFIDSKNRPSLAQTFLDNTSNKLLTVAVNHLKSKGSACDDIADPDAGDGQGNCNQTRTAAAEALATWLSADPTGTGSEHILIIGDLNAYAKEDPVTALKSAGYSNLIETRLNNETAYSFVFDGASGYLDHALANAALEPQITNIVEWHINADEPRALDYNTEFKSAEQIAGFYAADAYRSSDHDPLLLQMFVPGDLDGDGDVDKHDHRLMATRLGKCIGNKGYDREADYDKNGCVRIADYWIWRRHFKAYPR